MTKHQQSQAERVARYLRGEMTEDEASQLEVAMFDDDALFNEVRVQEALVRGIRETEIETVRFKTRPAGWHWGYAAFASLTMVVLGSTVVWQYSEIEQLNQQLQAQQLPRVQVPVYTIQTRRGLNADDEVHRIEYPEGTESVLIEIDVSGYDSEWFSLVLKEDDGEEMRWDGLVMNERGFLTVQIFLSDSEDTAYAIGVVNEIGVQVKKYSLTVKK